MAVIIAAVVTAAVGVMGVLAVLLDRRKPDGGSPPIENLSKHVTATAFLWVAFTALAVLGTAVMDPFPTVGAKEAESSDYAFRLMTYMAAPVFGFVIAALTYSILRFRSQPGQDGPPVRGDNWIPKAWLVITTTLVLIVMIYPGLTGLAEIRRDTTFDYEVKMTGFRWAWTADYPQGFTATELVLPVNQRVKFSVTAPASDVLHSFWVPAFRGKIDAVPGMTTTIYITPTELGDGQQDVAYRVQCAELCGVNHSGMRMNVRVVEPAEYERWAAEMTAKGKK